MHVTFTAPLWRHNTEKASWYFVTLPEDVADAIDDEFGGPDLPGFGSIRVEVTLGGSKWKTSVFPSKEHASFVLPVKAAVRRAEGIDDGDEVTVELDL